MTGPGRLVPGIAGIFFFFFWLLIMGAILGSIYNYANRYVAGYEGAREHRPDLTSHLP